MATTKSTTLTFRIEPGLKEALRTAAAEIPRAIRSGGVIRPALGEAS